MFFPDPVYDSLYGYCKECKNPMYIPSEWHGSIPPPVMKTCFGDRSYEGHEGLPCLAGDEFGAPLAHPVNMNFPDSKKEELINSYSYNFTRKLN